MGRERERNRERENLRLRVFPYTYYSPVPTKGGVDCNHWCLPGLPDTWNALLQYILEEKTKDYCMTSFFVFIFQIL